MARKRRTLAGIRPSGLLAIVDDDRIAHAEWHTLLATAPRVAPGDLIVAEWNELFSIGTADNRFVLYPGCRRGITGFAFWKKTILGASTGVETSLAIRVLPPLWGRSWFLDCRGRAVLVVALVAGTRCHAARKMRRQLLRLERQRELNKNGCALPGIFTMIWGPG